MPKPEQIRIDLVSGMNQFRAPSRAEVDEANRVIPQEVLNGDTSRLSEGVTPRPAWRFVFESASIEKSFPFLKSVAIQE